MRFVNMHVNSNKDHWIETLANAFDMGFCEPLNLEWLIDKAETGEWGGLWW